MQVSWIDADEVRDLVALLAEPPARAGAAAPDLDSLPEAGGRFGFELLTEKQPPPVAWQPQPVKPVQEVPAPSPMPAVQTPAVQSAPLPEVSEVREKLRQIRDRAQAAGLLTKENPVQTPAPSTAQPLSFPPVPAAPSAAQTNLAALGTAVASISPALASQPQSSSMASAPPTADKNEIAGRLEELAHWAARLTGSEEIFMLDDQGNLLWGVPMSPDILLYAKLVLNASLRSHAASPARPASATPVQVGPGKELQLVSCPTPHGYVTIALVNAKQVPTALLREAMALAMDR